MPPPVLDPVSPSAPWWLQAIYFLGVPAALSLFLVWFLTTIVVAGQNKAQETLDAHVRDMQRIEQLQRATCLILAGENQTYQRWCEAGR